MKSSQGWVIEGLQCFAWKKTSYATPLQLLQTPATEKSACGQRGKRWGGGHGLCQLANWGDGP